MSWSLSIFADSDLPLASFAKEVESALAIRLEPKTDGHDEWYEFSDSTVLLLVHEHTLVNDRELRFEDYRYQIALWPRRHWVEEVCELWRKDLAPAMFDNLKATLRYRLMLVEEVQRKLADFDPDANPVR